MRWLAIGLAMVATGCASAPLSASCAAGNPALGATLLFGRSLHGGGAVTDADFREFLAATVTPRFPDGLTTLDGQGQWRPRRGAPVTREPSSVLLIIAAPGPETQRKLQEIRDAYREQFHQDSVGLVTAPVCAAF